MYCQVNDKPYTAIQVHRVLEKSLNLNVPAVPEYCTVMHSALCIVLCIIKHDKNVLLNDFQWTNFDIIFQLPRPLPGLHPWTPLGDFIFHLENFNLKFFKCEAPL